MFDTARKSDVNSNTSTSFSFKINIYDETKMKKVYKKSHMKLTSK